MAATRFSGASLTGDGTPEQLSWRRATPTANGDTESYTVEGEPPLAPGEMNNALYHEVTPGYLETIGAELLDGGLLDGNDRKGGLRVIVINQFFANLHWPGRSRG